MAMSVNTNVNAFQALQSLNSTNKALSTTQNRVSTGLRVTTAKDDAASYSISQKMKSDVAGYEAVKIGLGLGDAALGTAIKAGEAISELLIEMKAKSVQAQGGGLSSADRVALDNDVDKLVAQVENIVQTASFNDVNLISSGASDLTVLADVGGTQKITVSAQSLDTATLGIGSLDLTTSANAATALTAIDNAISSVASGLSSFGSIAKQVEIQKDFTQGLIDQLNTGIGSLIDADMAQESAKLQAMQIKQQLGGQSLGIANQAPQSILGLFG